MVKKKKDPAAEPGAEERILLAARKVFVLKGLDGARMQDIADEAGINKALLHYYFRSKDQLFEKIFTETAGRFVPRVKAILLDNAGFYEKIERFCAEYIDMVLTNPFMPLFVLNEMNRQPAAFLERIFNGDLPDLSFFSKQLNAEIRAGRVRKISLEELLMNMLSLCIFPFIGRPLLTAVLGIPPQDFQKTMLSRKKTVPEFLFQAIRK
jgi:TetR/AcrR family transcriptional regulator